MADAERTPFVDYERHDPELAKVRDWLMDSERSLTETRWRAEAEAAYRFYSGEQDAPEVIDHLANDLHRPTSVHNEIAPKVNMLVGLAAQTKYEPTIMPNGDEDEALAELMNGVYKFFVKKTKLMRKLLECFEHTVKTGRSLIHFYIDKQNPFEPKIKVKRIDGRNFILDPQSVEYDMSDARFVFIDSWLTKEQIQSMWPGFDAIAANDSVLLSPYQPIFFNEDKKKFRIVECWYRVYTEVIWFVNPLTGKPESLEPEEFKKFTEILKSGDPQLGIPPLTQPLESVGAIREDVNYLIFSGDYRLEGGRSPYKWKGFPCVLMGAYKDDMLNNWFGVIKNMQDPQSSKNAMIRQILHMLQTLPKGILAHEVGAILNIDEYEENSASPNFHLEVAPGGLDKFKFLQQPQISPIFMQLKDVFSQDMKDVSGIQDTLLGIQTSSREPGVTVAKRQETGLAVLYTLFDNFAETRHEAGKVLLAMIQQYISLPQVVRIEGPRGMELVQINTQLNKDNAGFNDISTGEFDLVVDDALETTTMREGIAQMLTEYSHNNPGAIPPDIVMEYANLPFTIKRKIQQYAQQMQQQQQANIAEEQKLKLLDILVKADKTAADAILKRELAAMEQVNKEKDRQQEQELAAAQQAAQNNGGNTNE